jgi:hypothetical protein
MQDVDPSHYPMTTHSIGEGVQEEIKTMEGIVLVQDDAKEESVGEESVEATIDGKVEQALNETTTTNDESGDVEEMFKAFLEQIAAQGFTTNNIEIEIEGKQLSSKETRSIADTNGIRLEKVEDNAYTPDEEELTSRDQFILDSLEALLHCEELSD